MKLAVIVCAAALVADVHGQLKVAPQGIEQLAERMKKLELYCRPDGCKVLRAAEWAALQKEIDELLDRVRELEKTNLPAGMKCA